MQGIAAGASTLAMTLYRMRIMQGIAAGASTLAMKININTKKGERNNV